MCRAEDYSVVIHGDFKKALAQISGSGEMVNVFFLDPPYNKELWEPAMELIRENDLLAEGGMIVCEHRKQNELPDELAGFKKIKERVYGKVVLSIYEE
jgi:16S rRNA G966 N2-methylase RsmD